MRRESFILFLLGVISAILRKFAANMHGHSDYYMNRSAQEAETEGLVASIVAGIQAKKGRGIRVADLRKVGDTICQFLVVCEGNTPTQVAAICDSIEEVTLSRSGQKPVHVDGLRNAVWVAMDYTDVVAHVFVPEARAFYDIEHLWDDADMRDIPDDF